MIQDQKLAGYEEAQELVKLYQAQGYTNEQISQRLLALENQVMEELIDDLEARLTEEEKARFDALISEDPDPQKAAAFLKLDKNELEQKIKLRLQKVIAELKTKTSVIPTQG